MAWLTFFRRKPEAPRITVLAICCLAAIATPPLRKSDPIRTVLWAWERPEQLMSIDTRTTAVAVLDRTVRFSERTVRVHYRQHAVQVADEARLIAVVRLEGNAPTVDAVVKARLVEHVAHAAGRPRIGAIQIDFDATLSQRALYSELLRDIRAAVPDRVPLSITALVSWCADPDWLDALPIDEAVPMAFQMGPDADRVFAQLRRGERFRARICRTSIGISTDEPVNVQGYERTYIFNPKPWQALSVASLKACRGVACTDPGDLRRVRHQ